MDKKKNKNKLVLFRHKLFRATFYLPLKIYTYIFLGFRTKKYRLKKDENVIILSNHQTDFDPILVFLTLNKPLYIVATDTLLSNGLISKFLKYAFAPIAKKKGNADIKTIMEMIRIAREGGSLCLFPEGNRTYAEFQFNIDLSTVMLVKKLGLPLLLYNFKGGTGVMPRFFDKPRKGPFTGNVVKRIEPDEYNSMDEDSLLSLIRDTLKVYDSDSGEKYKSKARAQYLENMLFVCPKCKSVSTLHSNGNYIKCSNCGLEVEYTEDLHLKSNDPTFDFTRLIDWYDYQKKWAIEYPLNDDVIFEDNDVTVYELELLKKRKKIAAGTMILKQNELLCGESSFEVSNITVASPTGGRKFAFSCNNKNYIVISNKRFNPLKYVIMLNKLDSGIKRIGYDKNYSLET